MQMKANKNGVKLLATFAVLAMVFAGASVIMSDESDAETTYLSGGFTKGMSFPDGSTVVVNGDLIIDKGLTIIVEAGATFTINSGVKLTVDGLADPQDPTSKAKFIVDEDARLIINGDLVVGENGYAGIGVDASEYVENGAVEEEEIETLAEPEFYSGAFVYGSVKVQKGGELYIIGQVMNNGSIDVTSTGVKVSKISGYIDMMSGASVSVKSNIGEMGLGISSYDVDYSKAIPINTEVLWSEVLIEGTNYTKAADTSSFNFSVDSVKKTLYKPGEKWTYVISDIIVDANIKKASALFSYSSSIDESDGFHLDKDVESTDNYAVLSSSIIVPADKEIIVDEDSTLSIGSEWESYEGTVIDSANVVIDGTVSFKDMKSLVATGGEVVLTGTITADKITGGVDVSSIKIQVVGGNVEVNKYGENTISLGVGEFYGAYYILEGTDDKLIVCDLNKAMAAADGENVVNVTVSGFFGADETNDYKGAYIASSDFTVKSGVTLTIRNILLISEPVTVTLSADGNIYETANDCIIVEGKLIDNSMGLNKSGQENYVISQVVLTNEDSAVQIFTSMKLAIAGATSGDVIKLSGETNVKGDVTIPAGVTIVIGDFEFEVENDSVLTVDGVLDDSNGKLVTAQKNEDKKLAAGKVIVNNYIIVHGDEDYADDYNVSGIYTQMKINDLEEFVILSADVFISNVKDLGEATVQGTVEIAKDFTLENSEDVGLYVEGELIIKGTMTLKDYKVITQGYGKLTGKIANSTGTVEVVKVLSGLEISSIYDDVEEVESLCISGTPLGDEDERRNKISTIAIVDGTLVADGEFNTTNMKGFTVGEGTTFTANNDVTTSDLTISGTMNVGKDGSVTATTITVLGTVVIDEDSTDGIKSNGNIYVGFTKKLGLGAVAAITGTKIDYNGFLYVAAGSVIDSDYTDTLYPTEFYVEDALWMTVYAEVSGATVAVNDAPVTDGIFQRWTNDKGTPVDNIVGTDNVVAIGENDKVYAKADYNIYDVKVVADNGIGTVAIDGVVLIKSSNVFIAENLKAGTHTISFELKNGYEGTVKMTVNGQAVSGYNFTLSGTSDDDLDVTINLSGTAPAEPTTPVTPTPTPSEKDDGMGITDYLLIVLVIMVVILAIVVIARMFRS